MPHQKQTNMKKTFKENCSRIIEVIYNKNQKTITIKKWSNGGVPDKQTFENWATYKAYRVTNLKDFEYCSYNDIYNAVKWDLKNESKYPYPKKRLCQFNLY